MSVRRFVLSRAWCAVALVALASGASAHGYAQETRELELSALEDKIRGGLAGQMVGVSYGAPTEFRALGKIYEKEIEWKPGNVKNSIVQDDLYVEMTFAEVMDRIGLDATTEQFGEAFRDSKYWLWHANASARRHLNNGVKAPMSGHPKYNMHANDIDFQIEADFIGLMTPGMPQLAIELCDRVGRVMNYGDGLYGGMFVCGMYSEAYFESDVRKVVEAGVACLPQGSGYRAIIEDVIAAHCIWLNSEEIDMLKRFEVKIAHVPESNMKLASGIAPVPTFFQKGIAIGLGTDGSASNNDLDLFCEMDTTAKLHKVANQDPTCLNAKEIVHMATQGGAKVLNLSYEIGSLEVGKKADIIILDLKKPHLLPLYNLYSHLVYTFKGADVNSVVVDGHILMKNRKFTHLDENEILGRVIKLSSLIKKDQTQ